MTTSRREAPTEEIAAVDAYRTSVEAAVRGLVRGGVGDGEEEGAGPRGLVLERTVFHPRGGGQPGDLGTLSWPGGRLRVVDTVRRDGQLVHVIDGAPGGASPEVGTVVAAEIDWPRRLRLMRTHTALHALSGIVWRDYGARVTGGNMEPGAARMDFELEAMPPGFGAEVEEKLNAALARDHRVEIMFLPRAEALADPDLIRTKVNLIPPSVDPIRIVEIVGLDRQADGGTHVRSTAEVGTVRVVKTESKGRAFKRMRIELDVRRVTEPGSAR